jgi:hypothetical protein
VLRRIQFCVAVIAGFLAADSHWDMLQVFAWGRMLYGYSQTMPIADAVQTTLAPSNMCGICRLVDRARKSQESNRSPELKAEAKIRLFFQPVPRVILTASASAPWSPSDPTMSTTERGAPPLPPPRSFAA